jgi:hypothetical protein
MLLLLLDLLLLLPLPLLLLLLLRLNLLWRTPAKHFPAAKQHGPKGRQLLLLLLASKNFSALTRSPLPSAGVGGYLP